MELTPSEIYLLLDEASRHKLNANQIITLLKNRVFIEEICTNREKTIRVIFSRENLCKFTNRRPLITMITNAAINNLGGLVDLPIEMAVKSPQFKSVDRWQNIGKMSQEIIYKVFENEGINIRNK